MSQEAFAKGEKISIKQKKDKIRSFFLS